MPPTRLIYPPSANEQDFEELCLQLLRVHFNKPTSNCMVTVERASGVDSFDPSSERPTPSRGAHRDSEGSLIQT